MKKTKIFLLSIVLMAVVIAFGVKLLFPYYVNGSVSRYSRELKDDSTTNGEFILSSQITYDENVKMNYVSFNVKDADSQKIYFECDDGWRASDIKYIGFEKGTNNILVISGDTGVYRYVNYGYTWEENIVSENQDFEPDPQFFLINNLEEE